MLDENDKQEIKTEIDDAVAKGASFQTRKLGDTPTDDNQLTPKGWVDLQITSVYSAVASVSSTIPSVAVTNIFGDGSDGAGVFDGSSSVNGATLVSRVYTLTRDVYFTNTSILTASVLTNSFQVFVSGTTEIFASGKAYNNGGDGTAGTSAVNNAPGSGGAGGIGAPSGTLASTLSGSAGGNGGAAANSAQGGQGSNGVNGGAITTSIGVIGVVGTDNTAGSGGPASPFSGGQGGRQGSVGGFTAAQNPPRTLTGALLHADFIDSYKQHQGSGNSGGAGGGGGGGANSGVSGAGGGAGGSGGTGGIIAWYSKKLINRATGGLQAIGGNGANAGNGGNATGGGPGGGGGGGAGGRGGMGGVLITVFQSSVQSGTFDVSGGSGGTGGTGGTHAGGASAADGQPGANGGSGNPGSIWSYQI